MATKIDVLCKKEEMKRAEMLVKAIQRAADTSNFKVEINLTSNFAAFAGLSFNPAQTPAIFINRQFEFSGFGINFPLLQKKLSEIRDKGSQTY